MAKGYDTTVTRARRLTEKKKKLINHMENLCYAREHSVQFFLQVFYAVKSVWGPLHYLQVTTLCRRQLTTCFQTLDGSLIPSAYL